MMSRMNVKVLVGLAVAFVALAGCARRGRQPAAPAAVPIPAKNVQFYLVEPGKEKRSGLYAVPTGWSMPSPAELFPKAAAGKMGKLTANTPVTLIGKLPRTVREKDLFKAGAGTIRGREITVPVSYVRYAGPVKRELATRAVYVMVNLPALPAGKYRATLYFVDSQYIGDDKFRKFVPGPASKGVPSIRPLVCNFEVKAAKAVTIPAKSVGFQLVKPGKDRSGGLYAISSGMKIDAFSKELWFRAVAARHGMHLRGPGKDTASVRLVGRLPGTVLEGDFFQPEPGSIRGGRITIPVKFVRRVGTWAKSPPSCSVYFSVILSALPVGKYRATVSFADYVYYGDKHKITRSKLSSAVAPRFKPLVCEFEVKAPKVAAVNKTTGISWGKALFDLQAGLSAKSAKFQPGRPMEFAVHVRNVGKKARKAALGLNSPLDWWLSFAPVKGGAVFAARNTVVDKMVRRAPMPFDLGPGERVTVGLRAGGGSWRFFPVKGGKVDVSRPAASLPPGRYAVTAKFPSPTAPGPDWRSAMSTGAVEIEVKPAAKVSWGKAAGGLRVGLSPARVTLEHGEKSFGLRVCYENVGGKPLQVPDHRGGRVVNAFRIMFAGEKAGKPFYACFAFERTKTVSPRLRTLKPGERFSEEFRFPEGLGAGGRLPRLLPGESFTLRAGLCARPDPMGPKDWKAATTIRSGAITVTRRKYEISWGKAVKGLRVGLSPMKVTLKDGQTLFKVRVWYQNVGKKTVTVPVHKTPHLNAYRVMFAGDKAGKPFHAYYFMERDEFCPPGKKRLRPGERFSEEFPLEVFASRRAALAARGKGKGLHYFQGMPALAGGESLTLRVGLCAKHDPADPKDWKAATTLRSGAISVTRAAVAGKKP